MTDSRFQNPVVAIVVVNQPTGRIKNITIFNENEAVQARRTLLHRCPPLDALFESLVVS